ncbi:hypothetical protein Tcan_04009 [Toxocara canis]|uniref:C2H2-type domain-containing protein n=1 Tax=Toxocara canis TaxID=6265 RepID=A0A0B2UVM2_TOXCA|nr:hypothetical protein Tcan_04009 [Toxocara canis]
MKKDKKNKRTTTTGSRSNAKPVHMSDSANELQECATTLVPSDQSSIGICEMGRMPCKTEPQPWLDAMLPSFPNGQLEWLAAPHHLDSNMERQHQYLSQAGQVLFDRNEEPWFEAATVSIPRRYPVAKVTKRSRQDMMLEEPTVKRTVRRVKSGTKALSRSVPSSLSPSEARMGRTNGPQEGVSNGVLMRTEQVHNEVLNEPRSVPSRPVTDSNTLGTPSEARMGRTNGPQEGVSNGVLMRTEQVHNEVLNEPRSVPSRPVTDSNTLGSKESADRLRNAAGFLEAGAAHPPDRCVRDRWMVLGQAERTSKGLQEAAGAFNKRTMTSYSSPPVILPEKVTRFITVFDDDELQPDQEPHSKFDSTGTVQREVDKDENAPRPNSNLIEEKQSMEPAEEIEEGEIISDDDSQCGGENAEDSSIRGLLMRCSECRGTNHRLSFSESSVFDREQRRHHGTSEREIAFRCQYCKMGFDALSERLYHEISAHRMERCYCRACGSYFSEGRMDVHLRKSHRSQLRCSCGFKADTRWRIAKHKEDDH